MIRLLGGALLLSISTLASADPVAFKAISTGDLTKAERTLASQVAAGSTEPGVLLNLAHVYRTTARAAQAQALYRQVLAEPNVQMGKPDGSPAWSHDLATAGLARASQFAAR
ncbi:tetratricopeptide repeat protein [Sphingomonas prati]|uniref:Thioredoxin-like negative regulator of GroEL n=1 Tax=Sphingomonas prati TaxID=1843237 RepID=A0A7W9BP58_9SPHN|nr:tetratricopeptide repeat protein [Sphingomonas prati]MBB5727581.1 thioredoxin-like negative regulator of GroEL [Sphingomonas prati]GGE79144.1 hypothetical protein GCM10011404_09740 [Sphingomonas prati]